MKGIDIMKSFTVYEEYIRKVTQRMIQIDTVNDPAKITDYNPAIQYIKGLMEEIGLEIVIEGKENYPNIIGRLKGNGKSKRAILYNAHIDTVPVGDRDRWTFDPFGGEYRDGYCYGRGASDMAGQIAMLLATVKYFAENKISLDGDMIIAFFSGHETGSTNGSLWLVEHRPELLAADMSLIPEASNSKITVSSRGIFWLKATTKGLSGHTALFNNVLDDGTKVVPINAVHKMLKFFNRFMDIDTWMTYKKAEHLGAEDGMYDDRPIVEVNLIHAGEKQNTIPDRCTATIDIRFLPGQTAEGIMKEVRRLADSIRAEDPDFDIEFETDMVQSPPMHIAYDSELYKLAARNFKKVFPGELLPCGACAPGDAVAVGRIMPVAWLGPTWDHGHGYDERINIRELCDFAQLYAEIALDYLNNTGNR